MPRVSNDNTNPKIDLANKVRSQVKQFSLYNRFTSDKKNVNDNQGKKTDSGVHEGAHWMYKLATKLQSNPRKINPTVKKFVADKAREKRASQINKTMKGGSVPHAEKAKNPWVDQHHAATTASDNNKKQGFELVGKPGFGSKGPSTTKHQFKNESAGQHGWHFIAKKILKHKKLMPKVESVELQEKSPPGWEGTVKHMKKHQDISNPWALAWWQKNQGYTSYK